MANIQRPNEDMLNKAKELLNTKLIGEWTESSIQISGRDVVVKNQKVFPESYELIRAHLNTDNFRIKRHGGMYTQDFRMDRLNFDIDKDFTITQVYIG